MEKFKSLADYLEDYLDMPSGPPEPRLEDITDPKAFCLAVLNSREFRSYIVNGLFMRDIAPAILGRVMDQGWGKPVERVEIRDTTNDFEDLTPDQLEARALKLAEMARSARLPPMPKANKESVH